MKCCSKSSDKGQAKDANGEPLRPRFRKRDKILLYGKKMIRTVRGSISNAKSNDRSKKLYRILSPGSFLIGKKKDNKPVFYRNEPPEFLLDFESSLAESQSNTSLPTALINLIRSVK